MHLLDTLTEGLKEIDARGLRRHRRTADTPCAAHMTVDGRAIIGFASNDYLGLAAHPKLIAAIAEGAERYGAGSGGSHLLGGHSRAHAQLEDDLAEFVGGFVDNARALYFSTGYMANLATLTALAGRGTTLFSDALNHASLIDGARLSRADVQIYPHCDTEALSAMLDASDEFQTEEGYPKDAPGKGDLRCAGNYVGEAFDCLSLTLEMPFKDNANAPDERVGWSPDRCRTLGSTTLKAVAEMVDDLR